MDNTKQEIRAARSNLRSWFWPALLISLGLVWLLRNFDVLNNANIVVLLRLWPLLFIAVGLDILFARKIPALGAILGIGVVGIALVAMIVGPLLGWGKVDAKHATYSVPKENASSASIQLDVGVGGATITPITEGDNLFYADIGYVGTIDYSTLGDTAKTIRLSQENSSTSFGFGAWPGSDENLRWNVSLRKDIPLSLSLNLGVGDSSLDFADLQLTSLNLNTGVGRVDVKMPSVQNAVKVFVNGGVGTTEFTFKAGAAADILINGGVGNTIVNIPREAAVRVVKSSGLAGVNLPSEVVRVSGNDGDLGSNQSTWETPGFGSAEKHITITFNGGVGNLTVRY